MLPHEEKRHAPVHDHRRRTKLRARSQKHSSISRLKFACRGLEDLTSAEELLESSITNFYEGIKESEVDQANIMAARAKIEIEPAYSKVASRLLLDVLYRETMEISASDPSLESAHREYFKKYLKFAITVERVSPALLKFDLDKLARAMQLQRDDQFTYLGLQTLYDRYFIHHEQRRLETPQIFWMRVAMGLALNEKEEQRNERAIEFYDVLSKFLFCSATPTLFNSGTNHSQLSSCYLSTVMDDLAHIFKVDLRRCAALQMGRRHRQRLDQCPRNRSDHQRHQRQKPRRHPLPKSRQRYCCSSQPRRKTQGGDVRLSRNMASRHRRFPRAAKKYRR